MGCCMSSQTAGAPKPPDQVSRRAAMESRAPPPTTEEDTVKEVLSETPAPLKVAAVSMFPEPELRRITKNQIPDSVKESEACNRSPAKVQSFRSPDLGTRREHVRRSDVSPGRRSGGSVRIVQSRAPSRPQSVPRRRDPGESSGRKSRSPARKGVSRSPSVRKTNPSPGRATADLAALGGGRNRRNAGNTANSNGDESLENPLVSLECFIFL